MGMEINITSLFSDESPFVPFDCSNNRATLGDNAGQLTWNASKETAAQVTLLDSEDKIDAMRDFARASGGWNAEEVAAWSALEVNALFLQWVAGDVREAFDDADFSEWDWADYKERAEAGLVSSNLFRADDGQIYFSLSN